MLRNGLRLARKPFLSKKPFKISSVSDLMMEPLFSSQSFSTYGHLFNSLNSRSFISTSTQSDIGLTKSSLPYSRLVRVFVPEKKWLSYPKEVRDELNDNIFQVIDGMDNHGLNQDRMYDHLNQLVRDGYLNFDKYALMPSDARTALLNLLWHSTELEVLGR